MTSTIDSAGRIVIPKAIRDKAELVPGTEIEIELEDGRVVLSPAVMHTHLEERDGIYMLIADEAVAPLTNSMVESEIEALRTRR